MQIAEIGDGTPGTRGQCEQSMFSRAASASIVSPTVSMPAGPPSGPAKLARAPRWAMATAAFAALPPFTIPNELACVFTSGRGNDSTRKIWSTTAIPAHRTCFMRETSGEDAVALFDPGADDVVRDRDRRRNADSLRMLPDEHQCGLLAGEPARVFQFLAVDRNVRA